MLKKQSYRIGLAAILIRQGHIGRNCEGNRLPGIGQLFEGFDQHFCPSGFCRVPGIQLHSDVHHFFGEIQVPAKRLTTTLLPKHLLRKWKKLFPQHFNLRFACHLY